MNTNFDNRREQLAQWPNKRIRIEGTVNRVGTFYDCFRRANVPSYCLTNIEIREVGDHHVIDHIWCSHATMMVNFGVREGDVVRCTVQTHQYRKKDPYDPNKFELTWGFKEPRDITCINRTLQPEPERIIVPIPEVDWSVPTVTPEPPEPQPPADPRRALFDSIYDLVAMHGLTKVQKTLAAVEALNDDE